MSLHDYYIIKKSTKRSNLPFFPPNRFGDIRCLEATRDIQKGEEIFIDYSYDLATSNVPRWYRKLYSETYPEEMEAAVKKEKPAKS